MAISGQFLADFNQFSTAVEGAEIKLKSFETGSNKVEASLSRMTDSFSGRKVVQDATLMVEAIERVGGTSKLTEAELARVGATAGEAANKLRAMGVDVPPGLQKIVDATKDVNTAQGGLLETAKNVAAGFVAMFTIRAAASFVGDVVSSASALKDLSNQTHINVEELQVLAGGMSEFGVDADTLGRGLFSLSQKIAGGDQSVAHGLHLMGLSIKEVEGLQGQDLFLKMEHGLATLQGSLRDTAAADIFGSRMGAAMAGASEGIDKSIAKWREHNTLMTTETVDALDDTDEAFGRVLSSLKALTANLLGPGAAGLNSYIDQLKELGFWATTWERIKTNMSGGALSLEGTRLGELADKADLANLAVMRMAVSHERAKTAAELQAEATAKLAGQTAFLAALERDAATALEPGQIRTLEHLKEIGALTAQNAAGVGISAGQYAKYVAGVASAKEAVAALSAAQTAADALLLTSFHAQIENLKSMETQRAKSYGTAEQIAMLDSLDKAELALAKSVYKQIDSELERMKIVVESGKQHQAITDQKMALEAKLTGLIEKQILAEAQALQANNAALGLTAQGYAKIVDPLETYRVKLEALHAVAVEGHSQAEQELALTNELAKSMMDAASAASVQAKNQGAVTDGLTKVPGAAKPAEAAVLALAAASNQAASGFFAMSAELYNAIRAAQALDEQMGKNPLHWTRIGGYAGTPNPGGRVAASVSGGGGGVNITNYITQPLGTPEQLARVIDAAVTDALRNKGRL